MVVYTVIYCITHRPRAYTVQNPLSSDPSYRLSKSFPVSAALHTAIPEPLIELKGRDAQRQVFAPKALQFFRDQRCYISDRNICFEL